MTGGSKTGGGSNVEILDTHVALAAESSYVFTPSTPLSSTIYSAFRCVGMGAVTAALQLRGILNQDENTAYDSHGYRIQGGVETIINSQNLDQFEILNVALLPANDFFAIDFWFWPSIEALSSIRAIIWNFGAADLGVEKNGGFWHSSAINTFELQELEIETSVSTWKQDTMFTVYGYRRVAP